MTAVKGIRFNEAFNSAIIDQSQGFAIRVIQMNDLLKAKEASGRYRDKDDIIHLEEE